MKFRFGLRWKLIIYTSVVFAVLMALIGHFIIKYERDLIVHEMKDVSLRTAKIFASLSRSALIESNTAQLKKHVDRASPENNILYIIVQDKNNRVLASSGGKFDNQILLDTTSKRANEATRALIQEAGKFIRILQEIPGAFDVTIPMFEDGEKIGAVRMGFSTREMRQKILHSRNTGITMTAISVLIGASVLALLSWRVTIALKKLTDGTRKIASGDLSQKVQIHTSDELEELGDAFNQMADNLTLSTRGMETALRNLKETKDYLQSLLNNSDDMIITTNTDTTIVEFNKGAEKMLGYTKDEVIGKSIEDFYVDRQERRKAMKVVNESGGISNYETRLIGKDGRIVHINLTLSQLRNENGEILGTVGISKNVTNRKRAENEIDYLVKLLTNPLVPMITTELEGSITGVNQSFEETFQYSTIDLLGKDISLILKDHNLPLLLREIEEKGGHENGWCGEVCCLTGDGSEVNCYLTTTLMMMGENRADSVLYTFRIIEESKLGIG